MPASRRCRFNQGKELLYFRGGSGRECPFSSFSPHGFYTPPCPMKKNCSVVEGEGLCCSRESANGACGEKVKRYKCHQPRSETLGEVNDGSGGREVAKKYFVQPAAALSTMPMVMLVAQTKSRTFFKKRLNKALKRYAIPPYEPRPPP